MSITTKVLRNVVVIFFFIFFTGLQFYLIQVKKISFIETGKRCYSLSSVQEEAIHHFSIKSCIEY